MGSGDAVLAGELKEPERARIVRLVHAMTEARERIAAGAVRLGAVPRFPSAE